jgi:NADH-quinone oxidoreductase subunit D
VRKAHPYWAYPQIDFDVPVGQNGDNYDRYLMRIEELKQSERIIRQALDKLKDLDPSVYHADVPDFYLPEKKDVYTKMEALIYHFKIVMGEVNILPGEVYHAVEGGNGELGFYLISDGGRAPYRLHFRRPCFIYYQVYPEIVKGGLLSDAVITMSSMNLIAGELDG